MIRAATNALAAWGLLLTLFLGWLAWLRPPSQMAEVRASRSLAWEEATRMHEKLEAKNAEIAALRSELATAKEGQE